MNRINDVALLVGRLLFAALFLPAGISTAIGFAAFSTSLAGKGLAYADAWAVAAIAIEVLAPIALILGVAPRSTAHSSDDVRRFSRVTSTPVPDHDVRGGASA